MLCKFSNFISEARIAKIFYVSLLLLCFVRSLCFGVSTVLFVDKFDNVPSNSTNSFSFWGRDFKALQMEGQSIYSIDNNAINSIPHILVLLMLSPDYLFNFAYLNLIWQLYSFFFDGFASSVFKLIWEGKGQINLIFISFLLFSCQIIFTVLYMLNIMPADKLVLSITVINFSLPSLAVIGLIHLSCKFSGIPKREEYKSRLRKLQTASIIWSITRFFRAVTSLWDINLLFGMMINISSSSTTNASKLQEQESAVLIVPMILIVIFLIVEIWPIWVVLDGNFVDIFLKYSVIIEQKDLKAPLLLGGRMINNNDEEAIYPRNMQMAEPMYSYQNTISYASSTRQSDILFQLQDKSERDRQTYNSPYYLHSRNSRNRGFTQVYPVSQGIKSSIGQLNINDSDFDNQSRLTSQKNNTEFIQNQSNQRRINAFATGNSAADHQPLTMHNLDSFEFIKQGKVYYNDYFQAQQPINAQKEDSRNALGFIYRLFAKVPEEGGLE